MLFYNLVDLLKEDVPAIIFSSIVLVIALFGIILLSRRIIRQKKISDEAAYFNSMMYDDDNATRFGRLVSTYKKYFLYKYKGGDKEGYYLTDKKNNPVFEGYVKDNGFTYEEYLFTNLLTKTSEINKIGHTRINENGIKTFLFNNDDVWDYIKKRNMRCKYTAMNNGLALYSIDLGDGKNAFAKREISEDGEFYIKIRTNEKALSNIFLVFFAYEICED